MCLKDNRFVWFAHRKTKEAAYHSATKQPKQKLPVDINLAAVSRTEGERLTHMKCGNNREGTEQTPSPLPPVINISGASSFLTSRHLHAESRRSTSHAASRFGACYPRRYKPGYIIITPGKKELSHRRAVSTQVSSLLSLLLGGRSFFACHPSAARGHR